MLDRRASGVLLHPTSLPGPHGNGDLGPPSRRFVSFLSAARQTFWQMLPVGPAGFGNSPYSALSAFAGNPLLISLEDLAARGYLPRVPRRLTGASRVDYAAAQAVRGPALRVAFDRLRGVRALARERRRFQHFRDAQAHWLEEYALYRAIKRAQGELSWVAWPAALRGRSRAGLERARAALAQEIDVVRFEQFLFDEQWRALREHCRAHGVQLIGDLPLFVAHDSADVWAHPELFKLDDRGELTEVAGVPPDYFSATGQRWGNPLYRWERMRDDGFSWWKARLRLLLSRFDAVRLDHFIGFVRTWEIPAGAPTAREGRFRRGPGEALFSALRDELGELPLIAEDLGLVTAEVTALREKLGLPGIKILQFAFGTDPQGPTFLPHNYPRAAVAYTGTHDNDTTVGWFRDRGRAGSRSRAQVAKERKAVLDYLGTRGTEIHWEMIRCVLASVANLALVPAQDLLGLGGEARMNLPGTLSGNWEFRLLPGQTSPAIASRLAQLSAVYGRSAP